MKIPATVLQQMRTCVGVGALLAGGCDLAQAEDTPEAEDAAPTVAAKVVDEAPAQPPKGLASTVATAVDEAKTRDPEPASDVLPEDETASELEPLAGFSAPPSPPTSEDVTEFVPFSAPGAALVTPKASAKPRPRIKRKVAHVATSSETPVVAAPGWGADPCPPCGRG